MSIFNHCNRNRPRA